MSKTIAVFGVGPGMGRSVARRFGAGLLQISGPVGDSDAGNYVLENYDPALLPERQNPADLADAMWDLYIKRGAFDQVFGT